jgi:hypothetical protein
MADIYNNTTTTVQSVYDAYNSLLFSSDKRVFNKMVKRIELYMLVKDLPGDIMEVGVFKGAGMALFLKLKQMYEPNSLMKVIGFDYFEKDTLLNSLDGVNRASMANVLSRVDQSDLSLESVKGRLEIYGMDNFMLIQGDATVEAKKFSDENPGAKIKMLYMDLDTGDATYKILKELWRRVVKGGIVVFDEYAYHIWDETLGVDKFLKEIEGQYASVDTKIQSPSLYITKLMI